LLQNFVATSLLKTISNPICSSVSKPSSTINTQHPATHPHQTTHKKQKIHPKQKTNTRTKFHWSCLAIATKGKFSKN
jgi:hypothetical protein